jgi:uncharacterized repeat protein (TIGR01451 family)
VRGAAFQSGQYASVSTEQQISRYETFYWSNSAKVILFVSLKKFSKNETSAARTRRDLQGDSMINKIAAAIVMWGMLLWATSAFTAEPNQVEVDLHAFQVVAGVKDKLVPATQARPGDVIEYQLTYRNPGATPAHQVNATLPVPPGGMAYLEGSAAPAALQASLDGIHFSAPPLTREVLRAGRRVNETVAAHEYRFLRWTLGDLAAGQAVTVRARMRLSASADAQS